LKEEYDFSNKNRLIFTITTVRKDPVKNPRCVGFYYNLVNAITAVEENHGDIYEEGYYPYCVIEAVKEGIYCIDRKEFWFKWNKKENGYKPIPSKPENYRTVVCFGIG